MDLAEVERRLAAVLGRSSGWLPDEQLEDMRSLNRAGEPGVAFENYMTQLLEYDVKIPRDTWLELRTIGQAMGINEKYWRRLAPIDDAGQPIE
jgi:hypothetical protein